MTINVEGREVLDALQVPAPAPLQPDCAPQERGRCSVMCCAASVTMLPATQDKAVVFVCNHQSTLDIMIMYRLSWHFKWV